MLVRPAKQASPQADSPTIWTSSVPTNSLKASDVIVATTVSHEAEQTKKIIGSVALVVGALLGTSVEMGAVVHSASRHSFWDTDGLPVGESLGLPDGDPDGESEGVSDGDPEGDALGLIEGLPEGIELGLSEGLELGSVEGDSLGLSEGDSLGDPDGLPDGAALGESLGESLGA